MTVKSLLVKIGTDIKDLEAGFKKADGYVQRNAEKFKKAGKVITIAGAAITGIVGAMVKKASDAQETYAKFGTVFKSVFKEADAAALNLAKGYGLSMLASKDMLSATGDLLSGLGMLPGVALDLSTKTQQLAVDLASFTNYSGGAKGASESLTKAMLGEYESAKSLGIVIKEGMIKAELLAQGKDKLTGLARQQAVAEAILAIAYTQSKNSIGDYARTSDSLANVVRTLKSGFEDLFIEIGSKLIPIVTAVAVKVKDTVGKVVEWVKENPKLTGTIAKIVLGVGALMTVLGPLLIMLPGLAVAFAALTSPIGLVVAALALLSLKALQAGKDFNTSMKLYQKELDMTGEKTGWLAKTWSSLSTVIEKATGGVDTNRIALQGYNEAQRKAQGVMSIVTGTTKVLSKGVGFLGKKWQELAALLPDAGRASEETAKVIIKANEKITNLTKTMVDEIKKATLDDYKYSKWALNQKLEDTITTINAVTAAEGAKAEVLKALEKEKITAIALARKSFRAEDAALDKEHKQAERDRETEQNAKKGAILASLYAEKDTKLKEFAVAAKAAEDKHLAENMELIDSLKKLTLDRWTYESWALDKKYEKEKETSTNLGLLWKKYEEDKKALADEKRMEEDEARRQSLENTLADVAMVLNQIGSLFQMSYQNQMIRIDNEEKRTLEALDNKYDATIAANEKIVEAEKEKTKEIIASIDKDYEAKKQYIMDNVKDEEKRAEMLADLEKKHEQELEQARIDREKAEQDTATALEEIEFAKNEAIRIASEDLEIKRSDARKKAAKQEKAVALLSAIVNTAAAVVKALPNIPLAIAVGVLGAIQIALIRSKPIPLARGGLITGPTRALIGEAGPELVIPLNKLGEMQPAFAGGGLVYKQYVYLYGDINNAGDLDEISRRLAEKTRRALERG